METELRDCGVDHNLGFAQQVPKPIWMDCTLFELGRATVLVLAINAHKRVVTVSHVANVSNSPKPEILSLLFIEATRSVTLHQPIN
jgi:hypothetical protein